MFLCVYLWGRKEAFTDWLLGAPLPNLLVFNFLWEGPQGSIFAIIFMTLDIELYVAIYIVRYDEADGKVQIT